MSCAEKRSFYSERAAIQARIEFGREFKTDFRHYQCECGRWHLTSRLLWWQRPVEHSAEHIKSDWLEAKA